MSRVSFAQLLGADPAIFDTAASAWLALAKDLDDAAEGYIRASWDLTNAWSGGSAAAEASSENAAIRRRLSDAYPPARATGEALRTLAGAVRDLRRTGWELLEWAQREGYVIDVATGGVTAATGRHAGVTPDDLKKRIDSVAGEVRNLVARAAAIDDHACEVIASNRPDASGTFRSGPRQPVTKDEVERQRGRKPSEVKRWWEDLTPERQEQAIRDFPSIVGWLDGVPASDRDAANRLALGQETQEREEDRRRLDDREAYIRSMVAQDRVGELYPGTGNPVGAALAELERIDGERRRVSRELTGLREVSEELGKLGGKGMLLGIDPSGDGKAIIAVGNPDTARHTAVWVPGLGTDLGDTSSNMERVTNLQQAADGMTVETDDVAAIMWLGYDAPELDSSVIGWERSQRGGEALDGFVDGLRATHEGGGYHVTALGHSYGSTVVAEAARTGDGLAADDLVTAGSPGMHTDHASDFKGVNARHVWAGSAADDPVSDGSGSAYAAGARAGGAAIGAGGMVEGLIRAYEAGHGESPHRAAFGANRYEVDTSGHSDYWRRESQSLDNQARVVVGRYDDVGLVHGAPPTTSEDEPPAPPAPITPSPNPPPTPRDQHRHAPSPSPGPRP